MELSDKPYPVLTPADEQELVTRARQGEHSAWTALVRCHQEPVFRLAYLMLGDGRDTADQAADVAQETFIRAFLKLDQFQDGRPFRPWLMAIAANLARNRRRSLGRYLAALHRWWQVKQEEKVVGTANDARDDARLIWQAIGRLSSGSQEALYLRYFLDMSEMEMAALWDVAPGTVKSRLYRARQALQAVLAEEFPNLYDEWQR